MGPLFLLRLLFLFLSFTLPFTFHLYLILSYLFSFPSLSLCPNLCLVSTEAYDEKEDEKKGTNMALRVSEDFSQVTKSRTFFPIRTISYDCFVKVRQHTIGTLDPLRGVSSFKFIPHRESEVLALKTIEHEDRIESCMWFFVVK